ncbi:MAG: hypothetical protein M2R45_02964 [Verrucomicrobia subdivision 3 bacterium]|nr:hypothetical protein [Limisphaerales bacterium]MCS1415316.1 hypothetical protein [Limisphaerales bacterium]
MWNLLQALLNFGGFEKIKAIFDGDELLRTQDGGRERLRFSEDEYYLSFLGTPSVTEPWNRPVRQASPRGQPDDERQRGRADALTHRRATGHLHLKWRDHAPMANEGNKALALMQSLNATQQQEATYGSRFRDLLLDASADGRITVPGGCEGIHVYDQITRNAARSHQRMGADCPRRCRGNMNERDPRKSQRTWFA